MELLYVKDLIFVAFIGVTAWFSYRSGWNSGLDKGVDESLIYLSKQGFIEIEELEDGDIKITAPE